MWACETYPQGAEDCVLRMSRQQAQNGKVLLVARLASGPYRNSPSRSIFRFPLLSARQNELKVEESWQLSGLMGAIALCIPKVLFVKQSNRNLVMVTGR